MAYKTVFAVFALVLVASVHADSDPEEPCLCEKDEPSVWKFLQSLSVEVPEEDKSAYSVVPGELSPLIECDCKSFRRRRDVQESVPPVESPVDSPVASPVDSPPEVASVIYSRVRDVREKRSPCPRGQIRFMSECIKKDLEYGDY